MKRRLARYVIFFLTLLNLSDYAAPGDMDPSFNPVLSGAVASIRVQTNGKILVGGSFTNVNGVNCGCIVRLNADGSLDTNFVVETGVSNNAVLCMAVLSDNKIIIGGEFRWVNGTNRNGIARLNADGTLDSSFDPGTGVAPVVPFPLVSHVTVEVDGGVLIAGDFFSVNGTGRDGFARLKPDGSLDSSFNPAVHGSGINAIAPQTNGCLIIGGDFDSVNGTNCNFIARLNADGTLDTNFNLNLGLGRGVASIAFQSDGKILIGADMVESYYGTNYNGVGRLDENGNWDTSFDPGSGPNDQVTSIAVQPDGKVVIGGWFTLVNGTSRVRIARLNDDGSLDDSFNPAGGLDVWG
jgi:uncharacterized delta-60 repeat protein